MAKIVLFNPPAPNGGGFTREGRCTQEAGVWATQWPPLSLATAAAMLEADGHRVKVLDFPALGLTNDALGRLLQTDPPDFAIWSTATPTLIPDLQIARQIKVISPGTVTAVLGTHVTACPEEALSETAVDVVIRGEPEGIIRNLCRAKKDEWKDIPGISCRQDDGPVAPQSLRTGSQPAWQSDDRHVAQGFSPEKDSVAKRFSAANTEQAALKGCATSQFRHNPDADFLPPEAIPAPAWHLVDLHPYRLPLKGRRFLMVAPVRGCPYRCSFCTAPLYYGTKLRRRPLADILQEIETSIADYKIRDLFIWADTFTADRTYVREFCRALIERRLPVSWTCNSRVDTIDEETLRLMKEAGLWMISYGLESGNDGILERAGKKMTVAQSRKAVLWAKQAGICVAGHFIFGLPGETPKTKEETLALALDLPLDIAQFYAAAPFPGTKLHAEAESGGWLTGDSSSSQNFAVMELPELPAAEVDRFRRHAFRKFYVRPRTVLGLLSMCEWEALKSMPAAMKRFLGWTR